MESSIAVFLTWQSACELLPTEGFAKEDAGRARCWHMAHVLHLSGTSLAHVGVKSGVESASGKLNAYVLTANGTMFQVRYAQIHSQNLFHTFSAFWL